MHWYSVSWSDSRDYNISPSDYTVQLSNLVNIYSWNGLEMWNVRILNDHQSPQSSLQHCLHLLSRWWKLPEVFTKFRYFMIYARLDKPKVPSVNPNWFSLWGLWAELRFIRPHSSQLSARLEKIKMLIFTPLLPPCQSVICLLAPAAEVASFKHKKFHPSSPLLSSHPS